MMICVYRDFNGQAERAPRIFLVIEQQKKTKLSSFFFILFYFSPLKEKKTW